VASLAFWTIPRIGWRQSAWLLLEPAVGSFLIGSLILVVIRRRWIAALIGTILSAPFFIFGTGMLVYDLFFGPGGSVPSLTDLWFMVPTLLLLLSFVSALSVRSA
jgi:hypothetical protein